MRIIAHLKNILKGIKFLSKNNKANNNDNSKPKRRWLNIGPGLILALAVSTLIGSQLIKTEISARSPRSAPPIVERHVLLSTIDEKSGPTPEVKFIIDQSDKIHLSDAQLAKLKTLQSQWTKLYGPKIAEANQSAAKTQEYMSGAKNKSRMPVAQLQNEAYPLIALSGEISSARRNYWNRAQKVLNSEQRIIVQREREIDWAKKKAVLSR